jgi:uncharacterized protein YciI
MPCFVYLMENVHPLNPDTINQHIDHLRRLDVSGKLMLCGPFTDYPGGMVVFEASDMEEAQTIALSDPFIAMGYRTFTIRTIERADAANGYLG